ncbi:unnamed protein product [Acanthoscelides obtectus]|uniref:Uncharacterized protein n=1 Tax=Acanthoscelides obtectus TaxID=200917 RepID=A0A9P0JRE0_ACAOB|nr:unnamed protein product [Acanthoscelides obtectus]CAK1641122.1 hypothetical protein AOBTE_LOCUS12171 [Acanthoscelides obtectus]
MKVLHMINANSPDKLCREICCELVNDCLERKCVDCKNRTLPILPYEETENCSYKKWVLKTEKYTIKGEEKTTKRNVKDIIRCVKAELVAELNRNMPKYMLHISNMRHQHQFDNKIPISGIKTFVGTMKVHQACWTTTNPDYLELRRLSCTVCPELVRCVHYSLGHYEIKQNRPKKVAYSDIYTDSENEEEQMKLKTKSLKGEL